MRNRRRVRPCWAVWQIASEPSRTIGTRRTIQISGLAGTLRREIGPSCIRAVLMSVMSRPRQVNLSRFGR
jgi:hypothetical protein